MPTSTDLVTDLPADFETFGQAVDTSLADLKGGTSGQILSKASNTDMDFTWITNDVGDITAVTAGTGISGGGTSGAVTITNSMATEITASGDIIVGTGSGTFDNLPIGTTGQILTADTTVSPYKVKWATPAAAASGLTLINRTSVSAAASQSFNNVFSSTYENYIVTFNETAASTNGVITYLRFRASGTDTTTGYYYAQSRRSYSNTVAGSASSGAGEIQLIYTETGKQGHYSLAINAPQQAQWTGVSGTGAMFAESLSLGAQLQDTTAYDGFTVYVNSGTFTGVISIYGLAKA